MILGIIHLENEMNIGNWILNFLAPVGDIPLLLCVMLIFFIDALIFPALPELIFIAAFIARPTMIFGIQLFFICLLGELLGILSLYFIVKKIGIPKRLSNIINRYVDFLFVSDERILLLNRIVPMIPFCGAFLAIVKTWDLKKCIFYIMIGYVIKYGILLYVGNLLYEYLGSDQAALATLCFVITIIIVSAAASYLKRRTSIPET